MHLYLCISKLENLLTAKLFFTSKAFMLPVKCDVCLLLFLGCVLNTTQHWEFEGLFPFSIDLHSFPSASFLFPALNLKRKFEVCSVFFFLHHFHQEILRDLIVTITKGWVLLWGKGFSVYSGAGNNFFLTFHSSRSGRVGWGPVGKGILRDRI